MPDYRYTAIGKDGHATTGAIGADSRHSAIALLADRGVFVTEIAEDIEDGQARPGAWRRLRKRRRLKARWRAALFRQLATALEAGLPLLSGLRAVQDQADTVSLRELTGDLADRVQAGEALSAAMEAHPRDFTALAVSMVRVGETSGMLDKVMGSLADFAEREVEVREQIRSAATYPIFVLVLACISVVVIVTVILPRVLGTIAESLPVLPWPTALMLGVADVLGSYGWLVAIVLILAVWAFRAWRSRPAGRLAFDRFILRVPVLGTAMRRIAVGRFARTLGTLSKSGISILEALRVLRNTLGNEALARHIDHVALQIKEGQPIAEPLRQTGEFPPLLIQVIAMGERTGRLDELLLHTADAYDKETAAAVQRVMTILPAVFTVLLAVVVLFVLAAVLLPIVSMQTSLPGM